MPPCHQKPLKPQALPAGCCGCRSAWKTAKIRSRRSTGAWRLGNLPSGRFAPILVSTKGGKMKKATFIAAICVALGGSAAQAEPIRYPPVVAQIAKVESDFDAYTHDHGQTKGFFTFSAPDAIGFRPQA